VTPLESTKAILTHTRDASLGTLEGESPFVSASPFLFESEPGEKLGSLYLFLSDLARHTKNLKRHGVVSLLVVEEGPETSVLERARVTILGNIERVTDAETEERLREQYRSRVSLAEMLLSLPDFHFYRLLPREVHWIGGFGLAQTFKVTG
jgi:putative heme iron utilization protein